MEATSKCGSHFISKDLLICCSHLLGIHRSEGPSQVFLLTLTWLLAAFGKEKRERWQDIILSYDNMCHLDNLKVSKENLPLPGKILLCYKHIYGISGRILKKSLIHYIYETMLTQYVKRSMIQVF